MQKKDTGQKAPNTPKAVDDCHQLLLWLIPKIDQFPRQRRFTLGERLETLLMRVLEALVEASYRRDKVDALAEANLRLELMRHVWRVAFELRVINIKSFEHGARLMVDLGRQIGGWRRAQAGRGA